MILAGKKLQECFGKENHKKQIKNCLELKKVIKRKCNKLYVKRKGYNIFFNSWIDKKKKHNINVNIFQNRNLQEKK